MEKPLNLEDLEGLRPSTEEVLIGKIHRSGQTAKAILFCDVFCRKNIVIHPSDLSKYLKIDLSRASLLLRFLTESGVMVRDYKADNFVAYALAKNSDKPKITKYVEEARKVLGI